MTDDIGLQEDKPKPFLNRCAPNPYKPSVLFVGLGKSGPDQDGYSVNLLPRMDELWAI